MGLIKYCNYFSPVSLKVRAVINFHEVPNLEQSTLFLSFSLPNKVNVKRNIEALSAKQRL